MERRTILIADDMKINRKILSHIFEEQYEILEAEDGQKTIDLLSEHQKEIALLLLDLAMPKKTGLEVLSYMTENNMMTEIPVIMITGEATTDTDKQAYEAGVSDIIYKPFDATIVMRRAQNLIELFMHKMNLEEQLEKRTSELKKRTKQLEQSQKTLEKNNEFLVSALSSVAEYRSMEPASHVERVKYFTAVLLHHLQELYPEYGLTTQQISMIVTASALHDIGKIAISDTILLKGEQLNEDELAIMKKHTIYGCEILDKFKQTESEFYKYCYEICRYHHERYDGMGYPDHLKGEQIPIWAQAVALADAFDNLVTKRVYRVEYATEEAARMIREGECGEFSPKLLNCFEAARLQLFVATEKNFSFVERLSTEQ